MSSPWKTVEEIHEEFFEGPCWIVYKGFVRYAYFSHSGEFLFNKTSLNGYMEECITGVCPYIKVDTGEDAKALIESFASFIHTKER